MCRKIDLVNECLLVLRGVHMTAKRITTEQIGAELVEASKGQAVDSLPLSTRLFPYIFVASRRMSLRVMSRWLQENHGVSLSAAAISRALNNPELHLERFAESIAGPARYVAAAYGFEPLSLLFQEAIETGPSELQMLSKHIHTQPEDDDDISRWGEMQDLASAWLSIPHEVQLLLEPYLRELLSDGVDELEHD